LTVITNSLIFNINVFAYWLKKQRTVRGNFIIIIYKKHTKLKNVRATQKCYIRMRKAQSK